MKLVQVRFPKALEAELIEIITAQDPVDYTLDNAVGRFEKAVDIVMKDGRSQSLIEALEDALKGREDWRITVLPVLSTLPRRDDEDDAPETTKAQTPHEELYQSILKGCRLDVNFVVLTLLSAIVAALGLNMNSVAIVIGAMVIAPLLGPILALALAAVLGDEKLLRKAAKTAGAGFILGFGLAFILSFVMDVNLDSQELIDRTIFGPEMAVLALASGAAAALSLSTGLSSALVGVMVAVALLPPSVASALYLGSGDPGKALAAFLLLALNVVCVLLAAQLVFLWKGVRPRTWRAKVLAKRHVIISSSIWAALILALIGLSLILY